MTILNASAMSDLRARIQNARAGGSTPGIAGVSASVSQNAGGSMITITADQSTWPAGLFDVVNDPNKQVGQIIKGILDVASINARIAPVNSAGNYVPGAWPATSTDLIKQAGQQIIDGDLVSAASSFTNAFSAVAVTPSTVTNKLVEGANKLVHAANLAGAGSGKKKGSTSTAHINGTTIEPPPLLRAASAICAINSPTLKELFIAGSAPSHVTTLLSTVIAPMLAEVDAYLSSTVFTPRGVVSLANFLAPVHKLLSVFPKVCPSLAGKAAYMYRVSEALASGNVDAVLVEAANHFVMTVSSTTSQPLTQIGSPNAFF